MAQPEGLALLADVYFDQDWDFDYSSPQEVVKGFKKDAPIATVCRAIADLDAILASSMSEEELEKLWIDQLNASYMPTAADGITHRQWLIEVRRLLAE